MVKNHARKAAVRAQATATGEPYMQARRSTAAVTAPKVGTRTPHLVRIGHTPEGDDVHAELTPDLRILVPHLPSTGPLRGMDSAEFALRPFVEAALTNPGMCSLAHVDADTMTITTSDSRHRPATHEYRSGSEFVYALSRIMQRLLSGDTGGSAYALLIITNGRRLSQRILSLSDWDGYHQQQVVTQLHRLQTPVDKLPVRRLPVTVITVDSYLASSDLEFQPVNPAEQYHAGAYMLAAREYVPAPAGVDVLAVGELPPVELARPWLPVEAEHAHRMATRYDPPLGDNPPCPRTNRLGLPGVDSRNRDAARTATYRDTLLILD